MISIPSGLVDQIIHEFGKDGQIDILQEECAELIQACSKVKRGKNNRDNLKEEMAHVSISLAVVAKIYGISEFEIIEEVNKKCDKYGFKNI